MARVHVGYGAASQTRRKCCVLGTLTACVAMVTLALYLGTAVEAPQPASSAAATAAATATATQLQRGAGAGAGGGLRHAGDAKGNNAAARLGRPGLHTPQPQFLHPDAAADVRAGRGPDAEHAFNDAGDAANAPAAYLPHTTDGLSPGEEAIAAAHALKQVRAGRADAGVDADAWRMAGGAQGAATGHLPGVSVPTRTYDDMDIVIMYANGSEPVHAAGRAQFGGPPKGNARDRDNQEIRYAVRSIDAHMPWWRGKLIIYTDTPPLWFDVSHPRARVVLHTEVFPKDEQADVLPTFNSDSILSTMGNIPGLAKYFVKFDDDNFVGAMTTREDFIDEQGRTRIYYEKHPFHGPITGREDKMRIQRLVKAGQTWLAKMYNTRINFMKYMPQWKENPDNPNVPKDLFRFSKHAPVVMRTEWLHEIYAMMPDEFKLVRTHRFRHIEGLDVHALWNWYCRTRPGIPLDTGCAMWPQEETDAQAKLVILSLKNEKSQLDNLYGLADILLSRPKLFTLNDGLGGPNDANSRLADFAYRTLLPTIFPFRSSYELHGM